MERILSPERISIKIGTLVVETLYFFMTYMPQRDQVEKMRNSLSNVNHFFYSHIHLASFPFRPSRFLRALS